MAETACGYMHAAAMCGMAEVRGESVRERDVIGGERELPAPVVETVRLKDVVEIVGPEERWILEAVLTGDAFRRTILKAGVREVVHRAARIGRMSTTRFRALIELHYLMRVRVRGEMGFGVCCGLFFVVKDEQFDRTIFNGIPLNRMCKQPPSVAFVDIHQMLRRITDGGVSWLLSYDFSTWFVQLQVGVEVGRVFLVQAADGSLWRVTGVPMGWAWAPVVAQVTAEALVRETIRRVGDPGVDAFVYIDNVLFVFNGAQGEKRSVRVDAMFREVCREYGAHLKESAYVSGVQVDWLGVNVTAGQVRCTLRRRFVEKVGEVWEQLSAGGVYEVLVWWRCVALVVRALWVAEWPLAFIGQAMAWMGRAAGYIQRGTWTWATSVPMWRRAWEELETAVGWIRRGGPFVIRAPPERVLAVGVSDAASAGQARGYILRCAGRIWIARCLNTEDEHINVLEFKAMYDGVVRAMRMCRAEPGYVLWGGDNTVANAWMRSSWSPDWRRNGDVGRLRMLMKDQQQAVSVSKVPGGDENPADILTRHVNGSASLRSGVEGRVSWPVTCGCRGICEHVLQEMWRRLGVEPIRSVLPFMA